ncbi:MAG: methionyl-tRNA formyltransferase [Clostridia bacterium]|nr:methionyl-tRNA formyltransferase [Clostridia bacterium]
MKIMFMGTPEISATCLLALVRAGLDVAAVVTGEDKPRGRGKVMTPTAVRALAEQHGIPVLTPKTLRSDDFLRELESYSPELIVVVAYGKILPSAVLEYPKYGCINLHVSLLPKYRGAAPMQRAVMEGERETGVTVMHMAEGLDTGDIISQLSFPIGDTDTFETVHDTSAELGSELLVKTIRNIESGAAVRAPQDNSLATYAKKVEREDCRVDFELPASRLDCIIRGVTPIPGAFAYLNDKMLKLFNARPVSGTGLPGEVIALDERGEGSFTVACGEGALRVSGVIPEGRGRMTAGDFIRGRKIKMGDILK